MVNAIGIRIGMTVFGASESPVFATTQWQLITQQWQTITTTWN